MSVPAAGASPRTPGQRVASRGYGALLALLAPAYLLRLWWRGRVEPPYRHAIGERFGFYGGETSEPGAVWIHAVSLGETRAASALIDALRRLRPGLRVLLTHSTATGRDAGAALLREGDRQAWLPFDSMPAVRRFFAHFRPAVGVLMETEVWPNLVRAAAANGVPMVLANARLSARSERKGRRLAVLLRPSIDCLTLVLAQSRDDAARLRAMGAREVVVSGNLKFDLTPDPLQLARGRQWRLIDARHVVLAASTREGEEEALLAAWLEHAAPRPLLLIVPRHPQRFDEVDALVRAAGCTVARRSDWAFDDKQHGNDAPPPSAFACDVWLGDSLGEMALYYALADVALLGGSFAPLGGQNLIEAAACGCPLVMGPHTFNFDEAARLAIAAGAARRVGTQRPAEGRPAAASEGAARLLTDMAAGVALALQLSATGRDRNVSAAALEFAAEHRGAADRMAERLVALMPALGPSSLRPV